MKRGREALELLDFTHVEDWRQGACKVNYHHLWIFTCDEAQFVWQVQQMEKAATCLAKATRNEKLGHTDS